MRACPPLPRALPTPLGPVKVRRTPDLKTSAGDACCGICHWDEGLIEISADLEDGQAWATLFHEYTHMLLFNAGLNVTLGPTVQESVCDVIGTGMAHLVVQRTLTRPAPR